MDASSARSPDAHLVDPVFVQRWSPRAFSPEPVSDDELAAVFEAARWSPSWFNKQPWYFVYETDGPDRQAFLDVLMEGNRTWAERAPVIGFILANTELEDFMARSRDFDVGLATMAMIVQAAKLDLWVHLMGGIDVEAAHALTGADVADGKVICGFALGHRGEPDVLPDELKEREKPSDRRPVTDFVARGARLPAGWGVPIER